MELLYKVYRFNPEKPGDAPHFDEFKVKADPRDRILDNLNDIKWYQDGTLSFRKSCAHGVCGSDAIMINGMNRLACQTLVRDLGGTTTVVVEPLKSFRVVKDLVVDMEPFFAKYEKIKPYFIHNRPLPTTEIYQSEEDQKIVDDVTKCILCGACSSSCPSSWYNPNYLGPNALIKAFRFIADTRDDGATERIAIVNDRDGAWRCHTIFNCVEACPKEINLTDAMASLKKIILYNKI